MIEATRVTKIFKHDGTTITALSDVSFRLDTGKSLAICGPSGAGKSTLLNILGGLDGLTSGRVVVHGEDIFGLSEREEARFRRENLGFVFQFHHLLTDFTILENVMMPLLIQGWDRRKAKKHAWELLERVGIGQRAGHYPEELSGGEQQRAAISRAIIHKPKIILADEPTGNLDKASSETVFDLLCQLNRDLGATLIVVTHHLGFAKKLNHILMLEEGRLKDFV